MAAFRGEDDVEEMLFYQLHSCKLIYCENRYKLKNWASCPNLTIIMKIDRTKLKKSSSDVPAECKVVIDRLKACNQQELTEELKKIKAWTFGKCELYHWADVLDLFDEVLSQACLNPAPVSGATDVHWTLPCDLTGHETSKDLLLHVLQFTALLIEHSFTRHLYSSMEHLTTLLASSDMTVVLAVLNLLYVFSKRSNFITRLAPEKKQGLIDRLTHLAESWGGKDNGFGLAECCQDLSMSAYPTSATTLHFEFYAEQKEEKVVRKGTPATTSLCSIHLDTVDKIPKLAGKIMEDLLSTYNIPEDKKMLLFTYIRLAQSFSRYEKRLQCVQARLQAISILVYANAMQENVSTLLYNGFIEELVDVLEVKDENLMDIKAASLRTLTSIIHLDRNPKLNNIIEATGGSSYHGFLPVLVRNCIQRMTDSTLKPYPQVFATALFSFLYHLASYESGGDALVSCGMLESLLKVINWFGDGQDHITFVTRAVRVVDLITNLDMQAFQSHGGLSTFINRLEHEVDICRKEQPFVICTRRSESSMSMDGHPSPSSHIIEAGSPMEMDDVSNKNNTTLVNEAASPSPGTSSEVDIAKTGSLEEKSENLNPYSAGIDFRRHDLTSTGRQMLKAEVDPGLQCFPQRAALLKSMLNFLKKAIPDPAFSESIRHLMDGSLPRSLKHIISNAEYYGPSLFLLATDVVTVYVFQEPSLLSSLQDNGLTDVVLHALLVKDVPATREVLASLPNVFSALCLNARGLESFVQCKPFDCLFKVLLSPDYLPAMRRRRSSDPPGDTASSLGSAMDELMRHQPSLRTEATKAIIKMLEEVCGMGRDPKFMCQKPQPRNEPANTNIIRSNINNEGASSDSEEEEDEVASTHSGTSNKQIDGVPLSDDQQAQSNTPQEKIPIPLMDYVLNAMKFVEAILSNNTTDDHCREFVTQKGLVPLLGILGLPNLPVDFPASASCQAVAAVCKSILTLSHEPQVLKQGLLHLNEVLQALEPLHRFVDPPGGSVLLKELSNSLSGGEPVLSSQTTPLLHALSSAHAYITMFTHVCKVGQADIRSISVNHWGSDLGLQVLQGLRKLYTSLVWESTVLLAFCSEDILPTECEFGKVDLEKLIPQDAKSESGKEDKDAKHGKGASEAPSLMRSIGEMGSNGVSAAMESLTTSETTSSPMETEEVSADGTTIVSNNKKMKLSVAMQAQIKQIKPLLSASSRLGRALAELFGLLVKLSVGSPVRQRRTQQVLPTSVTPSPAARRVATALTQLAAEGLRWMPPACSPVPKLRLTFFICSVGFTSPMLFDEKKFPYHLMLQKFLSSGGQDELFEAFHWALSCGGRVPLSEGMEYSELPDGTGEFLDAWLMLVEKMVNTKHVLESTHTFQTKPGPRGGVPFSPLLYLIHTHKRAFNAVMNLWNKKPLKVYGSRMSESILAILSHIIKGEPTIRDKYVKQKQKEESKSASEITPSTQATTSVVSEPSTVAVTAPTTLVTTSSIMSQALARDEPQVNQEHLQQLIDMGFTREQASDALTHTTSLEQATEYILTHCLPTSSTATAAAVETPDVELSEEDQMMRAIAMSLGEDILVSTDQEDKPKEEKKEEDNEERDRQIDEQPLEKSVLNAFTEDMMPGCIQLLDTLPETVYRVCDLIVVVAGRNGDNWKSDMLTSLMSGIAELCLRLLDAAAPSSSSDGSSTASQSSKLAQLPESSKLAVRLHLLSLLFEEMRLACAEAVEAAGLLDLLVRLVSSTQQCLHAAMETNTPKWIAPLLLLLDLYEKISLATKRRALLNRMIGKTHTWKWFDDRSGRWCNYSVGNNKTIDDAYIAGETCIRFTAGRRRYTVQFSSLIQVNEETGNRRPIMLSLPSKEEKEIKESKKEAQKECAEGINNTDNKVECNMDTEDLKDDLNLHGLQGLMPDQVNTIIRSAIGLISIPVDADTLHAVMRLTLRVTRDHQAALLFAQLSGPRLLLELTQTSGFQGFTSLATLLFRHVLEDPNTLRHTMEKMLRSATAGTGSSMSGVAHSSMGSKEMNYVLRVLGPAACRCPDMFKDVITQCLRISLPPPKRDDDDSRLISPNTPQLVKYVPCADSVNIPKMSEPASKMLQDLLNALAVKYTQTKDEGHVAPGKHSQSLAQAIQEVMNEVSREITELQQQRLRLESTPEVPNQDEEQDPSSTSLQNQNVDSDSKEQEPKVKEDIKFAQPLLPKSGILRLLAELVRSYASCAFFVAHYTFHSENPSKSLPEDLSVLAYILDNLLPQCQDAGDKDCPALASVLVASLAACNHSAESQSNLAQEIKAALQRALGLPESNEKHAKLQALMAVISTVIDSCPVAGHIPNQVYKGQQSVMNNMVKILLKKGLVNDLARIPHSLDLASPNMARTVNAALKPLETLSRIVNQPQTVQSKTTKQKTGQVVTTTETIVDEPAASNVQRENEANEASQERQDAEGHAGEVIVEDVTDQPNLAGPIQEMDEATEHVVATSAQELDDVLDELLQRDRGRNTEDQVLGDIIMDAETHPPRTVEGEDEDVMIEVEVEPEEMDSVHDSRMITQDISEDEADMQDNDDNVSEADDDHDDDDDDDVEDEDEEAEVDDEDDDDEDEEDEQGSDMEGDDDEEFQDMEDDNIGDFMHLEEMLLPGDPINGDPLMFGDTTNALSYRLPIAVHDGDNGNDPAGPTVPPAPSNVTATHPLLVRHSETHGLAGSISARVHRAGRQRGTYRYNPSTQTLHVHFSAGANRQPNPPAILQRLLGPSAAADVLQLTHSLAGGRARLQFLTSEDSHFGARPDDDMFDDLFNDALLDDSNDSGVLSSVPSALARWTEEARVLDAESMHDCLTVLKPEIIKELEGYREKELEERKSKRKKAAEEDAIKKGENVRKQLASKNGTELIWAPKMHDPTALASSGQRSGSESTVEGEQAAAIAALQDGGTASNILGPGSREVLASFLAPFSMQQPTSTAVGASSLPATVFMAPPTVVTQNVDPALSSHQNAAIQSVADVPLPPTDSMPGVQATPAIEPRLTSSEHTPSWATLFTTALQSATAADSTPTQPIPLLTPAAPTRPTRDRQFPESESILQLVAESSVLSSTDRNSEEVSGERAATSQEGEDDKDLVDTESSEQAQTTEPRDIQSMEPTGTITPEITSDFTSSDAVTVNSSESNSEAPSVADTGTPSGELAATIESSSTTAASDLAEPAAATDAVPGTSSGAVERPTGEASLPEGVDPSFLAALPDNIRQEVIAEHMRVQRIQRSVQQQRQQAEQLGTSEVNADFLAALPPNIQEEVLAQQRAEQSRMQAQQARETSEQVDPAGFIQSLPPALRQQVLADMDDSMVAVLPNDLASEANMLRRQLEDRQRRLMQERLFAQGSGPLSAILRHSDLARRLGTTRYAIRSPNPSRGAHCGWSFNRQGQGTSGTNTVRLRGRHLLDHEALTCLLVLLFVDEPKLNTSRLHRVLRNLCYHGPTRSWVIRALLSILQRTGEGKLEDDKTKAVCSKKKSTAHNLSQTSNSDSNVASCANLRQTPESRVSQQSPLQPSWLSVSLDAALGCRANVFQIVRNNKKAMATSGTQVNIHPQASPVVCRHVLDTLISLAKSFPSQFLPHNKVKEVDCDAAKKDNDDERIAVDGGKDSDAKASSVHTSPARNVSRSESRTVTQIAETDFWDLLTRLDAMSCSRKGKGVPRVHGSQSGEGEQSTATFESSALGQLMTMLSHPVVRRSQLLTDRLLRLLGLVSTGLPDITNRTRATTTTSTTYTTSASTAVSQAAAFIPTTTSTIGTLMTSSVTCTSSTAVPAPPCATSSIPSVTTSAITVPTTPTANVITSSPQTQRDSSQLQEPSINFLDTTATADEFSGMVTSTPLVKSDEKQATTSKSASVVDEESPVLQHQLQLAVEVLTSKSCSEEGLEDATNLLLQLSRANSATRTMVLNLLLAGARELGMTVCTNIRTLLAELEDLHTKGTNGDDGSDEGSAAIPAQKGLLADRFGGGHIVVHAASKVKSSGRDLQLPSMTLLTNKTSSQQFLLRILKVIIQLRDAARIAMKKTRKADKDYSNISENVAMLDEEADVLADFFSHQVANNTAQPQSVVSGDTESNNSRVLNNQQEAPMEVDPSGSTKKSDVKEECLLPSLSDQLLLEELWEILGCCLTELSKTTDHHAVLVLQPAVEAFFLVHAGEKEDKKKESLKNQSRRDELSHINVDLSAPLSPAPSASDQGNSLLSRENSVASVSAAASALPADTQKFLKFAETHRTVLNHILRQSSTPLADGPFSVLVDHTRVLDFDVKRRYFRQELERMDEGLRREDLAIHVKRQSVFEDSFREIHRRTPEEWKHRFYIVFEGEEGQDAGGLLREWYIIVSREMFNPNYALFMTSPGDRVTYTVNPASNCNSNHLSYFKFVGRVIAKAIYDNKLLETYFTRSFYKHILGKLVKYTDMESEDYTFYMGMVFLLENNVEELGYELTFTTEVQEFGVNVSRDLKPNGSNIKVTEENKKEYVKLVCQMKMTSAIPQQLNAFLEGFYDIIPKRLISIFNEQELELLISGLPTIDIDDLKANCEYHKYQANSLQIQWFWRALRSFDQAERACFLQFVTGTSKVPLQGFSHLEGMNGIQKFQIHRDDRSTDRLPSAHTCFNQLDLPAYETHDKLRHMLLLASSECSEGFGLA